MADYTKRSREWLYDACYLLAASEAELDKMNNIYESSLPEDEQKKRFGSFISEKLTLYPEKEAPLLIMMGGCEMY